jgi:predicted GNAT family acetyltransferase
VDVRHDPEQHRFTVVVPDGTAELTYEKPAPDRLDLVHTFVPPGARGDGIAEALVRAALDVARASSARVVPSCPYVRAYFRRHPEDSSLLAQ